MFGAPIGILVAAVPAHGAEIRGIVRQGGTGQPVADVTVLAGDRAATTDDEGRFRIADLPDGDVTVTVRAVAWRVLDPVLVTVMHSAPADVQLWVAPERGTELVGAYRAGPVPGIRRVVTVADTVGIPGTFGDPLRLIASQPGVSRTPYDAGWFLIRGGDFDDPGLFLDGVRVPLVQHLGGFTSVFHPAMVSKLEFWPGVFPARFGGATSGTVNVVPARVGRQARALGGVNLVFASAFAEVPTPWGGVAVAARRSYLDGVLALVLGTEGAQIAPRFWDAQARVELGPHAITVLGFSDTASAPTDTSDASVDVRQQAAQIQGRFVLGDQTTLWGWVAWSRRDLAGATVPVDQWELQPGVRIEHTGTLPRAGTTTLGLEVQQHLHRIARQSESVEQLAWTADPYAGVQIGYPVTVWSELRLETLLGIDQPVRSAFSPRGGVRWEVSRRVELHAEVGQAHQRPAADLLYGAPDGVHLRLEQAAQVAGGLRLRGERAGLTVDVFHRQLGNLAQFERDGSLGQGAGSATGLETSARARFAALQLDAVYQYVTTRRSEDQRFIEDGAVPWAFDQPHRLELRAAWALPRDWTLGSRFRFSSGFPRSLTGDELYPSSAFDVLRQEEIPLDLGVGDLRLAPYHSVDVRVARTITFRRWRLIASLDVLNLYNRRVVEPVISGFGESRPSYGFGLPILPIFGIEGEFFR